MSHLSFSSCGLFEPIMGERNTLSPSDFGFLRDFFKKKSGYILEPEKEFLCASYLSNVMAQAGKADLTGLVHALRAEPESGLAQSVVEAMTINETMFFRDQIPFTVLAQTLLPRLTSDKSREKEISIWSTACSSGQEPYSIALLLDREKYNYPGWRFRIVGSDISGEMIDKAKEGVYSDFEISRGLSPNMVETYFRKEGGKWRVRDDIRAAVSFDKVNLLSIPPSMGVFDVIFCRNVLIYFDDRQRIEILQALRRHLRHGGFLMLGVSEKLPAGLDCFAPDKEIHGIYVAV